MIWLQLLYVYLKIGILGFGGGYVILDTSRRGGPLWLDFLAGVYRYCRYLSNDTRADRYQ